MPVFRLDKSTLFPPVHLAEEDGLLAIGGDLSPRRLLAAYRLGIFPWFNPLDPLLWWSPDPRSVLFPSELKVHKSMRPVLNSGRFKITINKDFLGVITACREIPRKPRPEHELCECSPADLPQEGVPDTWITPAMWEAYVGLHQMGFAHSVEAWEDGVLVGGLYGVSIGKLFFGESMFALKPNASKAAFIYLVRKLEQAGFPMVDCQIHNPHLESLGAREIPRMEFLEYLQEYLSKEVPANFWA